MKRIFMFSMMLILSPLLAADPAQSTNLQSQLIDDSALKAKDDDEQIQHLAIATLANMAQGIVNIGNNPDDPKAVAKEVAGIVANFTNFVVQAMKNPALLKVLEDEQLYQIIAVRIRSIQINDNEK